MNWVANGADCAAAAGVERWCRAAKTAVHRPAPRHFYHVLGAGWAPMDERAAEQAVHARHARGRGGRPHGKSWWKGLPPGRAIGPLCVHSLCVPSLRVHSLRVHSLWVPGAPHRARARAARLGRWAGGAGAFWRWCWRWRWRWRWRWQGRRWPASPRCLRAERCRPRLVGACRPQKAVGAWADTCDRRCRRRRRRAAGRLVGAPCPRSGSNLRPSGASPPSTKKPRAASRGARLEITATATATDVTGGGRPVDQSARTRRRRARPASMRPISASAPGHRVGTACTGRFTLLKV